MKVWIPSALQSYTQSSRVEATGSTLDEVLHDLDRQYPGIRFRIIDEQQQVRRHMRIYISGLSANNISQEVRTDEEVVIIQALSGG
ncbi:MAG TPA: MoaD/ThiS family protein [Methylophilaceae bacterium]|nr:MoaD/ThiS family protein [Methylophilaceae bacterium]